MGDGATYMPALALAVFRRPSILLRMSFPTRRTSRALLQLPLYDGGARRGWGICGTRPALLDAVDARFPVPHTCGALGLIAHSESEEAQTRREPGGVHWDLPDEEGVGSAGIELDGVGDTVHWVLLERKRKGHSFPTARAVGSDIVPSARLIFKRASIVDYVPECAFASTSSSARFRTLHAIVDHHHHVFEARLACGLSISLSDGAVFIATLRPGDLKPTKYPRGFLSFVKWDAIPHSDTGHRFQATRASPRSTLPGRPSRCILHTCAHGHVSRGSSYSASERVPLLPRLLLRRSLDFQVVESGLSFDDAAIGPWA
ncbi:hypothetical protein MSAN_02419700 [Mycena sanguinolenta]|uniref:Uncharacterized protein n=1 Tax=Mycena sanguinolenta TaxID=230812 RepID=A0A8H6X3A6_9AGAR|nr:hypothetical protein MSAN_02419700 [Mycena sanguinolenta]